MNKIKKEDIKKAAPIAIGIICTVVAFKLGERYAGKYIFNYIVESDFNPDIVLLAVDDMYPHFKLNKSGYMPGTI